MKSSTCTDAVLCVPFHTRPSKQRKSRIYVLTFVCCALRRNRRKIFVHGVGEGRKRKIFGPKGEEQRGKIFGPQRRRRTEEEKKYWENISLCFCPFCPFFPFCPFALLPFLPFLPFCSFAVLLFLPLCYFVFYFLRIVSAFCCFIALLTFKLSLLGFRFI